MRDVCLIAIAFYYVCMVEIVKRKRKLLLINLLSPGDIMMMTAAVRDLHRAHPGEFVTDVYTSVGEIWENNPHITKLPYKVERLGDQKEPENDRQRLVPARDLKITVEDPDIVVVDCGYDGEYQASINRSNQNAYHFIHGYAQDLEHKLGVRVPVTEFKGDIHISDTEKLWMSQVQELGIHDNFWLIFSGGKYDYTAKWWNPDSYQAVVDHFKGRILFAQCGDPAHFHPPLEGVVNLIGKTSARQLIRLMYHASGVICPVTFAMHLAAAVPMRTFDQHGNKLPAHRPCIVLAGGREAMHWEAYPHHQFMHTVGALPCCTRGGCWKSRCQPVGDNDPKDENLCLYPVKVSETLQIGKCQTMITPQMVSESISLYYQGGLLRYNKHTSPQIYDPELEKRESGLLAKYLLERFRPRMMLDIGCARSELVKILYSSGVDLYGIRPHTEILELDEDLPTSRISLCDLEKDYWKSPVKYDLILTGSAANYTGRSADNLSDTIVSNLAKGGVLIVTPPPEQHDPGAGWVEEWSKKLQDSGLTLLDEETDRIRRVTHRVGCEGKELVFMKS
jgi:ADP-heptose:LPS heptosyltransferase